MPIKETLDRTTTDWGPHSRSELEAALDTGPAGLSEPEVRARREAYGPNVLTEAEPPHPIATLLHQFRSPLIYILLVATVVTLALAEYIDAAVIFVVLALNAAIGFVQERKAESAVRTLMGLVAPTAHVIRSGGERVVESRDLVPGDLVLLASGQRVPADLRLVATTTLRMDESLLTGESVPVDKRPDPLPGGLPLAERAGMAFAGTVVASGRGRGYVAATADRTELGRIASRMREEEEPPTPLQRRMARFGRIVAAAGVLSAAATVALGVLAGKGVSEMFLVGVALAVSAVPEGLPVVLTITLAVGVHRMARRRAIIRRLPAVETLGSITAIGSDKTGTLTENRMTVQEVWAGGRLVRPGEGADSLNEPLRLTLLTGVMTNEADPAAVEAGRSAGGDPTEVALLEAARRMGLDPPTERERWPVLEEIPFEPERRYSASLRRRDDRHYVFVKGAPERVLEMCRDMATESGRAPLDTRRIGEILASMASRGLRVLAMAYGDRPGDSPVLNGDPEGLTFLGLQGSMDPPRAGVKQAIAACRRGGIRPVMITGDHADTARAIAAELGLASATDPVITGTEIERIDDAELRRRAGYVSVYARMSPEHKLRVVRALQARGEVVAVTGDGANDAPALKVAEVGVAMGLSGTDVAREAADMVLADDNFISIWEAVREGRITFDNLRKVTFFLVSSGAAEIVAILTAVAAGWPLPMLPVQILWLNLVTNGVDDVALAFEPAERGVADRPPRRPREGILSRLLWQRTVLVGLLMAVVTLALFGWTLATTGSLTQAQTVALTTMVFLQGVHAGNCRSEHGSAFGISPFSNRFLLAAVAFGWLVHVAALYIPLTQFVLRVEPIPLALWIPILAASLTVLLAVECEKWLRRRLRGGTPTNRPTV